MRSSSLSMLLQAIRYAPRSPAQQGLIDSLQRQSRATIAYNSGVTLEQHPSGQQNPCAWGSPRSLVPFPSSFISSSSSTLALQQVRGLNSSSPFQQQSVPVELASNVLEQSNVLALREELELLSKGANVISFSEFAHLASSTGCSRTDEEAAALCAHLQKACVVLRHQDSVYLRPEEIAEAVMMMMPRNKQDAEQKLSQVEAELKDLENVLSQLEQAAQRRTNFMLSLGLVVLVTQFIAFFYLTWWELSWDVMEPIGYMISLFYSICAYVYFLGTKGSQFDLGPFKEFWSQRILNSRKAQLSFDQERWDFLVKQRERIQKHLGLSHQVLRAITKH